MPNVTLTSDLKAQLIGWLNREKDYLLSIASMGEAVILPGVTGTLECIKNDLEYVNRLRRVLRENELSVDLTTEDIEVLADVARANRYENRREFWGEITKVLGE